MDIEKSGRLIYEERKKLGLTQKELAEKIGVTDKAVSKWEKGRGFPDVSLLKPLSKILNVSVTELIDGERTENNTLEVSDKTIIETFGQRKLLLNTVSVIITVIGAAMLFFPLLLTAVGYIAILFLFLGGALIALGTIIRGRKFIMCAEKLRLNFLYLPLALSALIAAIFLEALPDSFLMRFAAPPDSGVEAFYESCSYFDPLPMSYGNWTPMLTALTSCASAAMLVVSVILTLFKKTIKKLSKISLVCTATSLFFSITAVFIFSNRSASAELGIALLLTVSLILQINNQRA